jgi:uncharacterized alkaline shock family protein YloU
VTSGAALTGPAPAADRATASTPAPDAPDAPVVPRVGVRGRNRIAAKALDRVVAAVTADALGVSPRGVRVDLADSDGLLALTVETPIRVASLTRVEHDPSAVSRSGGPILERVAAAQDDIRSRVSALTGSAIARVSVTITGVDITAAGRVA